MSSHLATGGGPDDPHAQEQLALLLEAVEAVRSRGIGVPMAHIASSGPMESCGGMFLDAVRPGVSLYGLEPRSADESPISKRPAMAIRAKVTWLNRLSAGEAASYGRAYMAERDSLVAVIPLGYADGLDRRLSGNGRVLIRGMSAPIIGRVCMDQFLIDVTDVNGVRIGDEVVVLGADKAGNRITMEELAGRAGTIVHEMSSRIGPRLPRTYLNDVPETE
jgi:alanine racemase